jgi:glutathione S-transferase
MTAPAPRQDFGAGLILYDLDHSPFAARVRLAIAAKRLAVQSAPPPAGVRSAAYRAINPLSLVPALRLESGEIIAESEVIVDYLEERFPDLPLRPSGARDRAMARYLARLADLYLAPALKLLFEATKRPAGAAAGEEARAVAQHLAAIEAGLGPGRLAVGDTLSTADCSLPPLLFFAERCLPLLERGFGPRLAAYWRAVQDEPVVRGVLDEMNTAQTRRAAARARGEAED